MGRRGGRNQRRQTKARIPVELKRATAFTTTIYRPPENPPSRELGGKWRRVVAGVFTFADDKQHAVPLDRFFTSLYNTSGFSKCFVHRVAVWSSAADTTSARTIQAALAAITGDATVSSSYRDTTSQIDRRACVGFYVPSHLAEYQSSNNILWVSGDSTYWIELDLTFI